VEFPQLEKKLHQAMDAGMVDCDATALWVLRQIKAHHPAILKAVKASYHDEKTVDDVDKDIMVATGGATSL
jgi:hypothetical protein